MEVLELTSTPGIHARNIGVDPRRGLEAAGQTVDREPTSAGSR
jgi:hypothetical protein